MLQLLTGYFYVKMFLAGVAVSIFIALKRRERFGFSGKEICGNILLCAAAGFLGAKLLFVLENPGLKIKLAGLSLFGAIILMPILLWGACLLRKKKFPEVMDFLSPYIPLALAFVRIGCWHNGCCGTANSVQKIMSFTMPIQLVEAILDLGIVWYLFLREKEEHKEGSAYPVFLVLYGIIRLFTEIYREEPRNAFGLSNGQLCALISIAVGGFVLYQLDHNRMVRKVCRVPKKRQNPKK